MSSARHWDQDKESTLYIGNLDERCTDSLVWELMLQAGPIINVHLPKDRVTQSHQGYGFVEFGSEDDADYAARIMNQIRLWGKPVRVNKASADRRGVDGVNGLGPGAQGVGAELFVGNLDPMVDERVLFETFSRFGPLMAPPKIARDEATNLGKGYGFVSYADFDASDDAIANMHGQYLANKEVTVQYAYKKDGKGERHGDVAERQLAAQAKKHGVSVAIPAMPAALVMPQGTPSGPSGMGAMGGAMPNGMGMGYPPGMMGGYANGMAAPQAAPPVRAPQPPPSYNYPVPPSPYGAGPPNGFAPPPQQHQFPPQHQQNGNHAPPNRAFNQSPLQPPPSAAGLPARPPPSMGGYGGPMGAPGMQPPPGFAAPPPPNGFAPPQGFRPPPPQQQQYQQQR
ncbi:Spliceosome-associated protein 49 [Teratosphaeriaceae sp. CCFEE 6253]|nr:Spliceosome-associated protein 49 [Teratosphaeriaceae sp. CCFEE 6253]